MLRYLNEFVQMRCAPDLLKAQIFPDAKEISESMGMYSAMRDILPHLGWQWADPSISIVVVCDGHTPRTAALFAMRSKWQTYSIDPCLRNRQWNINRLTCYRCKVEACPLVVTGKTVLIMPHAHVNISDCLNVVPNVNAVIALPCCFPITWDKEPYREYVDENIHSEKNTVKIWINT